MTGIVIQSGAGTAIEVSAVATTVQILSNAPGTGSSGGEAGVCEVGSITLSSQKILDGAAVGDAIAKISSIIGTVAYTIESDPDSKFTMSGDVLLVNGAIDFATKEAHAVTIRATNSESQYFERQFVVSVTQEAIAGILGQSNAGGFGTPDGGVGYPSGTLQYNQAGAFVPAAIPLDNVDIGTFGFAVQYAIAFKSRYPNVTLSFVPHAKNATSFSDSDWNPGDALYEAAISRINAALTGKPNALYISTLIDLGESDRAAAAAYEAAFDAMVVAMRSEIINASAVTPFVCVGFSDLAYSGDPNKAGLDTIKASLAAANGRLGYVSYVNADDLNVFDNVHFDAASLRVIGSKLMAGTLSALQNSGNATGKYTFDSDVLHEWNAPDGFSDQYGSADGVAADGAVIVTDAILEGEAFDYPTKDGRIVAAGTTDMTGSSYSLLTMTNFDDTTDFQNLMSNYDGGAGAHVLFYVLGNITAGTGATTDYVTAAHTIVTGEWLGLGLTYDVATTTMRLYFDGVMVDENTSVPAPTAWYTAMLLGAVRDESNTANFQGLQGTSTIVNRALTADEVAEHMTIAL